MLSPQGKDGQKHSHSERGADGRTMEEQMGKREGEKQDTEEHRHFAGDRAEPLEGW